VSTQFESVALPPRLPLVVLTSNRGTEYTKDARLVNCYMETNEQQEVWVIKRPGFLLNDQVATAGSLGRGVFFWKGDTYSIFDGTLFRNGTSIISSLDTTGGVYRFSSILGATPKLVLGNGAKTYAYTVAGGLTSDLHTIDTDFPTICVKGFCYLGGATYVMNAAAEVWGSAINSVDTAGSWDPLNFIAAQMEPDAGVFLGKQLVYAIAFNEWSTEVFFDAGNPVASPLGNVQGSKISYGCANGDSVQQVDDKLLWLSSNKDAFTQFSLMDQLNHQVISTPAIDRLLRGVDTSEVYSFHIKIDGHAFCLWTFPNSNLTLVYDLIENHWSQWTDTDGNYFPFVDATCDTSGHIILQHEDDGALYYCNASYYTDNNQAITVDIYTPNFDANSMRRKQMKQMRFVGDRVPGSILQVRCNDDDYDPKYWTNFRKVSLEQKDPRLTNCGTFVRRAYNFRHKSSTPLRLQAVDVQYDMGVL
jgi:hypothetical protein